MARVTLELKGTTPLLVHNVRLADPQDKITKAIAKITAKKRKMTEEDRAEVERLEWYGGLYTNGDAGPVMPTKNIKRCLVETGKVTRQGKDVGRALAFVTLHVPIIYDGPQNIDELYEDERFRNRSVVGVQRAKTVRVRPCFPEWSIVTKVEVIETILDVDDVAMILERAGMMEGLGDNRINGYGRFEGSLK